MVKKIEIPCNFVGSFKVGDNLVFNAGLLCSLVEANQTGIFNKLIVLQAGSIVEAALDQIIYRAQNFNREGVPNISEADRAEIAAKKVDKLNNIIQAMKKYKILDCLGNDIYDELHKLRKYRNKVHIQDTIDIQGVPPDEGDAFSDEVRKWSLELVSNILTHLKERFPRPADLQSFVKPLQIPVE